MLARGPDDRAVPRKAMERVDQEIQTATKSAAKDLSAVKAKITADINALKADV